MTERIKRKKAKRIAMLIIAVTCLIAMAISASAASANGGTGALDGSVGSENDYSEGAVRYNDPVLTATGGDAWEVSLYIKNFRGSFLLYGNQTLAEAGGDEGLIRSVRWARSNGVKNSATRSNEVGITGAVFYDATCPPWNGGQAVYNWGTSVDNMEDFVLYPMRQYCGLPQMYVDKITAQINDVNTHTYTEEEIQQKLSSGEWLDFMVTLEPVVLYHLESVMGRVYDFSKREEMRAKWLWKGRESWYYICERMGNAKVVDNIAPGEHNQPHSWSKDAAWEHQPSKSRDNYAVFWPQFNGQPKTTIPNPEKLPDPTPATETGFDVVSIKSKEIIANIVTDWVPDTASNRLAANLKEIQIKEKTDTEGGKRVHSKHSDGSCGHKSGEPPNQTTCGSTIYEITYCDQLYTFQWTQKPTAWFDEHDLKSESNVMGNTSVLASSYTVNNANKYQFTRKNGVMDVDWPDTGNVFDVFKWDNYNTNGVQIIGDSGQSSYSSVTGYASPIGGVEPFRSQFTDSINAHRFAKYKTDNIPAGTVQTGIIPLAGYMFGTKANQDYLTWMQERGLAIRTAWKLNEVDAAKLKSMYDGDAGANIKWGHGGDRGTSNSDSDLIWNNTWQWSRVANTNAGSRRGSHGNHSPGNINHDDTCGSANYSAPISSADDLITPRAEFARTLEIESTEHGTALSNLIDSEDYYLRKNSYGNDRLTMRIPSTVFEFSPTYRMYADYTLNERSDDYDLVWMLASDVDKVQFYDLLDFNLIQGETVVRAPWSRDYYDTQAADYNTREPISILKAGSAYHVLTSFSTLKVTGIIHYWDVEFFEPGSPERAAAEADNQVVQAYMDSINSMLDSITDSNFGFYTNQIGGTTRSSKFRLWPDMNPEIFKGKEFVSYAGKTLSYVDPLDKYPKLELKPNLSYGYVTTGKQVNYSTIVADNYRLDGNVSGWDSSHAVGDISWTDGELHKYIPDGNNKSAQRLQQVLVDGRGDQNWYIEDYEGIRVVVFEASVIIPAIESNPATLYEKLSDFRSDMNQWSPEMKHPIIQIDGSGSRGYGDDVIIKKNSIGAGTYMDMPNTTVYSGGIKSGGQTMNNWTVVFKPFIFGVRGNILDYNG